MKIVLFTYLFPNKKHNTNGIYNYSRVVALKEKGCEVIVIAPISLSPHRIFFYPRMHIKDSFKMLKNLIEVPNHDIYNGIEVYYPKWFKLPDKYFWKYKSNILHLFLGRQIERIIDDFQPDLIISSWLNPFAVYSKYLKRKTNAKYFAIFEGSDVLFEPDRFNSYQFVENIINKYCDELISVSQETVNAIKLKRNLKKLHVIKNGFDEKCFRFAGAQNITPNGRINIVNIAKFNHIKGQDVLIKAMSLLDDKYHLTLVGDGPMLESYQIEVNRKRMNHKINFTGAVSHEGLSEILSKHNIFCLPSRSEGLPAAPLEAMSVGLPVVSSSVGGMRSIIKDGENGLLCEPDSAIELAEKLKQAASIKWDYKMISQTVQTNYGWNKWAEEIIDLYFKSKCKTNNDLSWRQQ